MPLRGESVGTAYVRVLADASGFPRSLKEEFKREEPGIKRQGNSAGKAYLEGIDEEVQRATDFNLGSSLRRALGRNQATQDFFKSAEWGRVKKMFETEFGDVGALAAHRLEEKFVNSGSLKGLEQDVENTVQHVSNIVRDMMNENNVGAERNNHAFIRLSQTIDHMAVGIGRAFGKGSRNNFLNFFGSFTTNAVRTLGVIPRLIGNLQEFADGFKKAGGFATGFFTSVEEGFATMAKDAEGAQTALAQLFSAGPLGFAALAGALLAIIPLMSILAALVTGIAAAIVALASSISFALVGALVTVAPLLLPVAAGIGGIVAAIVSLGKTQRQKIFKPLIDDLKALGKVVREGFMAHFNVTLGQTHALLKTFEPLARGVGDALGDVGTQFVKGFQSPAFQEILRNFTAFIPDAIRSLGRIAQHTAGLVGSILVDAIPFARQFLGWLERITGEADKWVRKHPGKVFDFLHDAVDSAKHLAHFLGTAGAVLVDLLFNKSGKKAGDTIIDDMTKKLHDFDRFLDTHPDALKNFFKDGQQTARDIGNLARNMGDFFAQLNSPEGQKALHGIFQLTNFLIDLASTVAGFGQGAWLFLEVPLHILGKIPHAISVAKRAIGNFFGSLFGGKGGGQVLLIKPPNLSWIPTTLGKINDFRHRIGGGFIDLRGQLSGIWNDIKSKISSAASTAADNAVRFIRGIPGRLSGIASQFGTMAQEWAKKVMDAVSGLPGRILNIFAGLGGRIADVIGSIHLSFDFPDPPSWLSKLSPGGFLAGKLTATGGVFDRAAMRIIGEDGPEAVVPLNRPLSRVDPSVRWLSAIAQGLTPPPSTAGNGQAAKIINNEWNLTMPGTDPRAAAAELLNRMVASAY